MSNQPSNNLRLAGEGPDDTPRLSDFVHARLAPQAQAYWTAFRPNLPIEWDDAYSTSLGQLCSLLAERDELADAIGRTSEGETGLMTGQKGEMRKHPLYPRLNQVEAQIFGLETAFGLTPAGLARIQRGDRGAMDKADALLGLIEG